MFPQLTPSAKAATYYLIALGLCTALSSSMRSQGEGVAVLAMLTPLSSVLLMQLVVTRDGWSGAGWTGLGLQGPGRKTLPAAFLVPLLVLAVSETAVSLAGLTHLDLAGIALADQLIEIPAVAVFVLAEELGWRGYLLPLLERAGRPAPGACVGLLHGLWHLPIVFLVAGA